MSSGAPLLSFLLMIASGWVHRRQLLVIEFLQVENRLLKERLRGKRIWFTDAERALLARKAKAVSVAPASRHARPDEGVGDDPDAHQSGQHGESVK